MSSNYFELMVGCTDCFNLELRDRIGRFLDFFPIISDARFLSVRSEIGRFFLCVHYS